MHTTTHNTALAQRSSPQFSGSQFGSDAQFASQSPASGGGQSSQGSGVASSQANSDIQLAHLHSLQQASNSFGVSNSGQAAPSGSQGSRSSQSGARPSNSIAVANGVQQQHQQPVAPSSSSSSSSASSSSSSRAHHQQQAIVSSSSQVQPQSQQPKQPVVASSGQHHHAHQHHQHHHQPNHAHSHNGLQTQQTSQSLNNQNHPGLAESNRRAEATSASLAAANGQPYRCPDSFGYFRHHKSCDKYWACDNSTAQLKVCGNGLMFDDSDPKRENCAYPFSVDCGSDRVDLEPPISTAHCPRLYGLFPDTANCRVFYSCWNGESSRYECPPGLAYDNEQRVCVWADTVDRCDQSEVSDGFVCPDATEVDQPGHYTRHAHPTDCRKFYVCIEGVARPYGCSLGTVFNVDSLQCDEPENVSGCEKYYGEPDPKIAKLKLAQQTRANSSPAQSSSSSFSQSSSSSSSSSVPSAAAASSSSSSVLRQSSAQGNANH